MDRYQLLQRIKADLQAAYGDRLRGVLLFGSEARGEAAEDSDVGVLVLLAGEITLGRELQTITQALYPLQLEVVRPIHALPVNEADYAAGAWPLYRAARAEGIMA